MTPRMTAAFGPIRADQKVLGWHGARLERASRLVSVATGDTILDAHLDILHERLPAALIAQLRDTEILFGQLLLDHKIVVEVAEPVLFQTDDGRFGRQTTMADVVTGARICDVIETMAPDEILTKVAANHNG